MMDDGSALRESEWIGAIHVGDEGYGTVVATSTRVARIGARPRFTLTTTMPSSLSDGAFAVSDLGREVRTDLCGDATGGYGHVALSLSSHDVSGRSKDGVPARGSHAFTRGLLCRRVRVTIEVLD